MAEALFWFFGFLIAHTYVLYPCLLFVLYGASQLGRDLRYLGDRRDRRCVSLDGEDLPSVSLVIPAYNEERHLPRKLENIAEMGYPEDKLQVVFVSDGSTDATSEILRSVGRSGVTTLLLGERRGKACAINEAVQRAKNDILVFSDASTRFRPDALGKLVRHFRDESVGVVCGALRFQGNEEHRQTEGIYWKYESALRVMEARLGATLTASGAIYAVRRSAFVPLSADVMVDDLVVPMNARKAGFGVVYDPEAVAVESAADSVVDEYARRVRIAVGSFRGLADFLRVPLSPVTLLAFLSHKVLRWILPLVMIGLLVTNLFLLHSDFYRLTLALQLGFYAWAALGFLFRERARRIRYALMAYFLLAIHLAYLVGFARLLTGRGDVRWQRAH